MFSRKHFILAVMAFAASFSISSVGNATWNLIDDFDHYPTGQIGAFPGNSTGDVWYGVFNGTAAAFIQNVGGTDKAAGVFGVNNNWRGMATGLANNYSNDFSLADGATATYFYQFNPTSTIGGSGSGFDCVMGLSDTVANIDFDSAWADFAVMPFFSGANDGTADFKIAKSGYPDITIIQDATLDTWYNVWLVVDNANKLVDIYTSTGTDPGVLAADDATYRNGLGTGSLTALGFMEGTNKGNNVLFNNFYQSTGVNTTNPLAIPEPISLVLLGLCGLVRLIRRR